MLTDEKKKEIRKQLRKGIPEGELKEQLIKEGYSDKELKAAFAPAPYDMRSWYLISGVVVFLIGVYLFMNNGGILIMVLSAGLFIKYFREEDRLKKKF
jgi:hypothetical protein